MHELSINASSGGGAPLYNQSTLLICLRHLVNGARGFRAVAPGTGQVIDEQLGGQDGN